MHSLWVGFSWGECGMTGIPTSQGWCEDWVRQSGKTPTLQLLSSLYPRGDLHTRLKAYKHSLENQKGLDRPELLNQERSHPGSCVWLMMFIWEEEEGRPLRRCWLARGGGMATRTRGQVGCQAGFAPHQRPLQSQP